MLACCCYVIILFAAAPALAAPSRGFSRQVATYGSRKVMTPPAAGPSRAWELLKAEKSDWGTRRRNLDNRMFYFDESPPSAPSLGPRKNPADDVTLRSRKGELLAIPQAMRYKSSDWLRILAELPYSETLHRIASVLLTSVIWSSLVMVFHLYVHPIPTVQYTGPELLKSAMGYLLVFRTNAAYNRFWEGRRIWQKIVDQSRTISRYCVLYKDTIGPSRCVHILRLVRAFCLSLKQHVSTYSDRDTLLIASLLTEDERDRFFRWGACRPLFIAQALEDVLHDTPDIGIYTGDDRLRLLDLARDMAGTVSSSERIVQTPVPLNYARHTSRLLILWCFSMPIALVGEIGWLVVPVTAFVSWALFAIQEIGLIIEEPFSAYLSLDVFAKTVFEDTGVALQAIENPAESSSPSSSSSKSSSFAVAQ
uniref:Bestrophin homolog n=1 Tax=Lotharella globosa TaxID=91324 RepID=A0A7S3YA50_9EUKA